MAREKMRIKKKVSKNIATGVAHVNSTFNNTKILISDVQGNAISWSSAGTMGFKGSRKSTPYAAQLAAEDAGKKAQDHGVKTLEVEVQGPGSGRESALRALAAVRLHRSVTLHRWLITGAVRLSAAASKAVKNYARLRMTARPRYVIFSSGVLGIGSKSRTRMEATA